MLNQGMKINIMLGRYLDFNISLLHGMLVLISKDLIIFKK
jgi:hypothetical protein